MKEIEVLVEVYDDILSIKNKIKKPGYPDFFIPHIVESHKVTI